MTLPSKRPVELDPLEAVVMVDHGSRRLQSNAAFETLVAQFAAASGRVVEPAHMELAPPSILDAFGRLIARGAGRVIVHPFFLLPGRHVTEDIPALCRAAAAQHGDIPFSVTEPVGASPDILTVIENLVREHESG